MRLEHVIARNMARLRGDRGWTQADLAAQIRRFGLPWTSNRVTQLETLRRPVSLMEITALAWVFAVPLTRLLEGDEHVTVSCDISVPLTTVRAIWSGDDSAYTPEREHAEDPRYSADELRRIAKRIGTTTTAVDQAAVDLYGRSFLAERDKRAGNLSGLSKASARTKRGHVTRTMIDEIATYLSAGADREKDV